MASQTYLWLSRSNIANVKYINWIVSMGKCTIRATNHLSWQSCTYFHHLPVAYTLGQVCTSLSHYSSFYFQVVKLFDLPFLEHLMLWVLELFEMHSFHLCSFTCFCTRSSVHTWHQLKIIFKDLTQVYSVWLFFWSLVSWLSLLASSVWNEWLLYWWFSYWVV